MDSEEGTLRPSDEKDFVEFAGRSVTEAIGAMLVSLGYEVSAPIHVGEHGWELDVRANGRRFWLQITRMEGPDCILKRSIGSRREGVLAFPLVSQRAEAQFPAEM